MLGFWGGDNHQQDPQELEDMLESRIRQRDSELYQKRQQILEQRLSIIKSQGGMNWQSTAPKIAPLKIGM